METKHTPEPWMTKESNGIFLTLSNGETHSFPIIWSEKAHMDVAYIVPMDDTKHADAYRIVACVNALAGLNPEGVRDAVEAFKSLLQYEGLVVEYMGALGNVDAEQKTRKQFTTARHALAKLEDVK